MVLGSWGLGVLGSWALGLLGSWGLGKGLRGLEFRGVLGQFLCCAVCQDRRLGLQRLSFEYFVPPQRAEACVGQRKLGHLAYAVEPSMEEHHVEDVSRKRAQVRDFRPGVSRAPASHLSPESDHHFCRFPGHSAA